MPRDESEFPRPTGVTAPRCPRCGSTDTDVIEYGYGPKPPPGTIIGGCMVPPDDCERWGCRTCGYRWLEMPQVVRGA
jgi:hypothetical protein